MSQPQTYDLQLYQGDSFSFTFRLKDSLGAYVDLTGATPSAQIRANPDSTTTIADFTCVIENQSTMRGGVTISLSAAQTTGMATAGFWDVQLEFTDGTVKTYLKGAVTVGKEITR